MKNTVSACCGAEVETRYSIFIDGNQYTCTKCRLVNCDVVERPTPTHSPTETVSEEKIKGWKYLREFSPNQVGLLKEYKELERKNEVRLVEEQESYLIKVYIPVKKEEYGY